LEQTFGKYTLLKKLATGGMAEVWLARQTGIEGFKRHLVIKRILPHLADDPEFVQMFLNEARIAANFNHPNIAQIYDLGEVGGAYYIAMEFVHGEDLGRIMRKAWGTGQWIAYPIGIRIVALACEGLYYAHTRNDDSGRPLQVVHRDISPQNILIGFDGSVKVVDFGIAKAVDSASMTKSGAIKGKFAYMAPEQASGRPIDHRADLFAIGLTLYELLTGTRPLKKDSEIATLQAALACDIPPPSQVAEVPGELDPIVMRAIAKKADDRYPDARQFGMALEEFLVTKQWIAGSVQISELMATLFADRLAEEAKLGRPDPGDDSIKSGPSIPGLKAMPKASLAGAGNQPSRSALGQTKEKPPSRVSSAVADAPAKRSDPNMTTMARQPTRSGMERRPTGSSTNAGTSTQAPRPPAPPGRTPTRTRARAEDDRPEPAPSRASDFSPEDVEDREPSRSVSSTALPRTPSLKGVKRTPTRERRAEDLAPEPEPEDARDAPAEETPPPRAGTKRPAARDARAPKPAKRRKVRDDGGVEPVPELDGLEDVEALKAGNRRKLVAVLLGTVAAAAFISALIFGGALKEQFTTPQVGDQDVFLTVDTNIPVTVLVRHHPDEHKKDHSIEELGQAPGMRKTRGAHLRDTIILKNDPLGAYYEHEIQYGVPGTTVTITKEFQRGTLKLTVLPKRVQNLSVVMNGEEIGRYPGMKIDLYEGKHDLELQGEQLRDAVPFSVEIKPDKTADATVDVSKHLL
jgi:eukaryotic-like serine/threonine-protein kinase